MDFLSPTHTFSSKKLRNNLVLTLTYVISLIFVFLLAAMPANNIFAQDPYDPYDPYSPPPPPPPTLPPLPPAAPGIPFPPPYVRCDDTRPQEFHSLRPYQASPCNQDAENLALFCGNDFILIDTVTIDKIYSDGNTILGLDWEYVFDGNPIDISQEQFPDAYLACSYCNGEGECIARVGACNPDWGCQYDSNNCTVPTCVDNGDGTETCNFIIDREIDIAINLSGAELPIMGYTEPSQGTTDPYMVINSLSQDETLTDPQKVNEYVSWYLNGTIGRAEYDPPQRNIAGDLTEEGESRVVNYSGPLKRLLAFESQIVTRWEEVTDALTSISTDCDPDEIDPSDPDCIRHNQHIGCYNLLGHPTHCYPGRAGVSRFRLADWISEPPLRRDYPTQTLYSLAYQAWQILNPRWRLFSYIPFSSTEDRKGQVEITSYSIHPPSTGNVIILNSAITNQIPSTLFFAHMQESFELADILQRVFSPQEADLAADPYGVSPSYASQCNIVEYRVNPGDNLFATELSATVEYTAQVTCNYMSPIEPGDGRICNAGTGGEGECYSLPQDDWYCDTYYGQVDCQATEFCGVNCNEPDVPLFDQRCDEFYDDHWCYPNSWSYTEDCIEPIKIGVPPLCPRGYFCGYGVCAREPVISPVITPFSYTETCTNQVPVSFRTITETPLANEVWSKLVSGPAGAFRRIFPQIEDEEGRPIRRLWDLPAATGVTYSVLTGNVSVVGGDRANLYFPHIGGIHEYFLNCIQKTLRPYGYGQGCVSTPENIYATSDSCPVVPDSQVPGEYLGYMKEHYLWLADIWSARCPGPENNLAEECYNYVVSEAVAAGINPAFTLTIWMNESGASNYCNGGPTSQDFGINISSLYMNLVEQLEHFLFMGTQQYCLGVSGFDENMHRWLGWFRTGGCNPEGNARTYYENVRNFTWQVVTQPIRICVTGTRFGIDWPTDNSCP